MRLAYRTDTDRILAGKIHSVMILPKGSFLKYPYARDPCTRLTSEAPLRKGPLRKDGFFCTLAQGFLAQRWIFFYPYRHPCARVKKIDPCARVPCIRVLVKCLVQGLLFLLPCTREPYASLSSCKKGSNSLEGKDCSVPHMPINDLEL